jgi:putative acetyltransferase
MLHLGQIGIFRRMAGSPVEPENYLFADIQIGTLRTLDEDDADPLGDVSSLEITSERPTSPAASKLIAELTSELAGQYDHAPDGTGDFRPGEEISGSVFLVGRLGSLPVACGAIRPLENGVAEVKRMFVNPDYRGRGLSKQMLDALEDAATNLGYVTLRLETGDRQRAAIALYEKAGFHRIEPFGIYVGCEQSVCFEKHIAPASVPCHGATIIAMTTAHVSKVTALWETTEGLILTDTDNAADLDHYFNHNPGMSHVAVRGGEVVGAVLCGHDGRRGYLHHLAVATGVRNQGIGRALVNACLSKLIETGIRQCNLFVIDDHADGRAFWENDGWSEWPSIRLMSKKLNKA